MKIINVEGSKINACFVFEVGDSEISVSTIFNADRPEIALFDKKSGELLEDDFSCVQDAIVLAGNLSYE